jgi:hypothetical protein
MILRDGYFSNLRHRRNCDSLSMVNDTAFMKEDPGNGS